MEQNEIEAIIKEVAQEILEKIGFSGEVKVGKFGTSEEEKLVCDITSEESSFLIGQHGVNLESLEHLLRVIVRKRTQEKVKFIVDVNGYRQEKSESVIRLAREMAGEAVGERRAVILRPMSPYERRLVHMELAENSLVETESVGEGENRKIVIKPVGLL